MSDIEERCNIQSAWDIDEDTWHARRLLGLGGSEVGTLAGVSKYNSELQLFAVKTGAVPHDVIDNEAIRWGKRLERPVADEYAERENVAVVNWPVMLQLKSHPWMLANLDFLVVEQSEIFPAGVVTDWKNLTPPDNILAILEIKTGGIGSHGSTHEWGTDESEQLPPMYEMQVRHYQIVTGIQDAWLVGLLGGHGLAIREVQFDKDYAEYIIDLESRFWNEHVLTGIPPEPDGSDSAEAVLKALYPTTEKEAEVDGGSKLGSLWADYLLAKKVAEEAEFTRKAYRAQILAIIGSAEYAAVNGRRIASYKMSKEVEYLDQTALETEQPEVYKQYLTTRPGHRSLREIKA